MRIVFLTNHAWGTPNKAGFHRLAEACEKMGHQVLFITTGLSIFSFLRGDIRLKTGRPRNHLRRELPGLFSYLHFTLFHPHTLMIPLLNRMTAGCVRRYDRYCFGEAESMIREADVIFYESCSAICLLDKMKKLAPRARHIYRASDIIRVMRSLHPEVFRMEQENIPRFDMVSVPNQSMYDHFRFAKALFYHGHGVDKDVYDQVTESPYPSGTQNCVFIGTSHLDVPFLRIVCEAFRQVQFHIIGPFQQNFRRENLHYYGRMEYLESLKYLKFATVGLYCLSHKKRKIIGSFGQSMKIIQYQYCRLPIVLPSSCHAPGESDEFFYYDPQDTESIINTMRAALSAEHKACWSEDCHSWREVANSILSDLRSLDERKGE